MISKTLSSLPYSTGIRVVYSLLDYCNRSKQGYISNDLSVEEIKLVDEIIKENENSELEDFQKDLIDSLNAHIEIKTSRSHVESAVLSYKVKRQATEPKFDITIFTASRHLILARKNEFAMRKADLKVRTEVSDWSEFVPSSTPSLNSLLSKTLESRNNIIFISINNFHLWDLKEEVNELDWFNIGTPYLVIAKTDTRLPNFIKNYLNISGQDYFLTYDSENVDFSKVLAKLKSSNKH